MTMSEKETVAVQASGLVLTVDLRTAQREQGGAILLRGGGQTRHS